MTFTSTDLEHVQRPTVRTIIIIIIIRTVGSRVIRFMPFFEFLSLPITDQ